MVVVAVLLLPGMGLLLFTMTCLEDRLFGDPDPTARHARRRHLRLIPGGRAGSPAARRPGPAGHRAPAHRSAGHRSADRKAA
ncbi:conserved exported protein of unknown function [Streptomyces ambofaciens ATCC 23877]|uniref:Uncharacterized protein n=2 Tax=Streptomyces ambofaciens TaxID=1889 RepID=A0A0K2B399_STRA7|nr:hypothetical protein [Streptomyces ambofaciens]AKZ59739.1 conserved exported protein of unknown function [Streptomyces ambofaciens ATCC 23877]ANB09980.1 hypothetical protein SAM40697_6027 [Streptomyces ambofaciens]